jgi:hypothetical protein
LARFADPVVHGSDCLSLFIILIYSTVPSISGKQTHAHIFCCRTTKITDAYRAKDDTAATFLKCFQDHVCSHEAPTRLIADNAPMYRGWCVTRYLRDTWTSLWQAEAKYQHQNYAENRYRLVKLYSNKVMDPITVIAPPPSKLQGRVFLTKPD